MKKVAYLGPAGTYSEKAAKEMVGNLEQAILYPMSEIPLVVEAVAGGQADAGIVPLRTADGDVTPTLKKLHQIWRRAEASENGISPVYITGYKKMPIEFYLAGLNGTSLNDVQHIYSKQQATDACEDELLGLVGSYESHPMESTVLGAKKVAELASNSNAALCSLEAVESNGLVSLLNGPIIKSTAFISLGTEPYSGSADETAVMIRLYEDRPNQLHGITGAISSVNITDIHLLKDMPDSNGVANAVFILRLQADKYRAQVVIDSLDAELKKDLLYGQERTSRLDVMGSYPVL